MNPTGDELFLNAAFSHFIQQNYTNKRVSMTHGSSRVGLVLGLHYSQMFSVVMGWIFLPLGQ